MVYADKVSLRRDMYEDALTILYIPFAPSLISSRRFLTDLF